MSLSSHYKEIIELNKRRNEEEEERKEDQSPNPSYSSSSSPNSSTSFFQIDHSLELGSIHSSKRSSSFTVTRSYPWSTTNISNVPRTILSSQPIKDTKEYKTKIQRERILLLLILTIITLFGPLVFRYCLGCQSSKTQPPSWGSNLDNWEIYILITLFASMTGSIIRLLPVLCGVPATIESVKPIKLEGNSALCLVSPFCAEGDEMLLRSMLGRTATLFHTVGSRHRLNGLYLDVTMNERRLKGEATRKNIYYEWMGFLTTLIKISQKNYNKKKLLDLKVSQTNSSPTAGTGGGGIIIENKYSHQTNFKNRFQSFRNYGESIFDLGRNSNVGDFVPTIVIDSKDSIQLRKSSIRKSTIESTHLFRPTSIISRNFLGDQSSSSTTTTSTATSDEPSSVTNGSEKSLPRKHVTIEVPHSNGYDDNQDVTLDNLKGDDRDVTNRTVLNGLTFELESIEPVINFFDQWLAEMKLNERIYHYGDKK